MKIIEIKNDYIHSGRVKNNVKYTGKILHTAKQLEFGLELCFKEQK